MIEIQEFLLARIVEDEATAHALDNRFGEHEHWFATSDGDVAIIGHPHPFAVGPWGGSVGDNESAHIARHDPARVLAECEAKRELLEIDIDSGFHPAAMEMMRVLAAVYKDHPDYRKEWGARITDLRIPRWWRDSMSSFFELMDGLPRRYDSPAQAAEDLAPRIIAAETTEDLMSVIGMVCEGIDQDDHSRMLITAFALVAKNAGRQDR